MKHLLIIVISKEIHCSSLAASPSTCNTFHSTSETTLHTYDSVEPSSPLNITYCLEASKRSKHKHETELLCLILKHIN